MIDRILRAFSAGWGEMADFVPRLLSILRQLWLEVIGFVFFALALFFAMSANGVVQSFQRLGTDPDALPKLLLALVFVLMFGWFGWTSFRRAKRAARDRDANDAA